MDKSATLEEALDALSQAISENSAATDELRTLIERSTKETNLRIELLQDEVKAQQERVAETATRDELDRAVTEIRAELAKTATRDELDRAVTEIRAELAKTASRDELDRAVTEIRTELAKTASREELDRAVTGIRAELARTATREELQTAVKGLNGKLDIIVTHVSGAKEP